MDTYLPNAFDFLPLGHFTAISGGLPNLSIENALKFDLFCSKLYTPKFINFCLSEHSRQ